MSTAPPVARRLRPRPRTFRGVLLRGLSLLLPPILTIVILLWVANTVQTYVLEPVKLAAREVLVWATADVREEPPGTVPNQTTLLFDGQTYTRLASGQYVPSRVVDWLHQNLPDEPLPATGEAVYRRYVEARQLQPQVVVPVFLCVFVLLLYVLGKFLTKQIGGLFDWGILRLPMVRKVYAAVKQVTDFVFGENLAENLPAHYKRVVAIEYPRPGLWSIGLVMGEAITDVSAAVKEPCVTVMLPTSPALFTVKPVMIAQSKTHNVNMTIDQALQFIISCGVVLPSHQLAVGAAGAVDTENP
ncbi:MAG TPA: DUF502 domain-containing protein [Pirellulales bacterium]|nr:DUF502 domain-containing protein [Pirellulales bacterium]